MKTRIWQLTAIVVIAGVIGSFSGCAGERRARLPEQDLTPFQRLVDRWTAEYSYRRTVGGDDLVSQSDAIIERPTHEERLHISATLFADTLVKAEIERICEEDTIVVSCDSIAAGYAARHNWPKWFRVEISTHANLPEPFALEPLTIYITDENDISYEPVKREFATTRLEERSYLDREVKRYDPYTSWEYRVYEYQQGVEYASSGHATLYFERVNVVGRDLLDDPDAQLVMTFRTRRSDIASLTWNLADIRRQIEVDAELTP